MRVVIAGTIVAAALAGCIQQQAAAAREEKPRSAAAQDAKSDESSLIGKKAPDFEGLIGTDDKKHSLKDYKKAKAVVVVFTCNHCPVAQAYEERIQRLGADYSSKGVRLVAINVNNLEADKLDKMKERAKEKGFKFPYLYDSTQKVGRDYGARVTPHVFVLDGKRRVAYIGAIDDSMDESKVTQHYLRDAIDAVLAGKKPQTTEAKPEGCSIRYESRGKGKDA